MNGRAHERSGVAAHVGDAQAREAAERAARALRGEESLRELARVPDAEMNALYAKAGQHCEAGDWVAASQALLALVATEPREPAYWFGLGGCEQARGQHESAVRCFAVAALLDGAQPTPHLFAAQSWRVLGDERHALLAVEAALGCSLGRPEHVDTFCQALRLREAIRAHAM